MVRQYRIDRFNGQEVFVCEVFTRFEWSPELIDKFNDWIKQIPEGYKPNREDFRLAVDSALDNGSVSYFGVSSKIPLYNNFPYTIIRAIIVDNRPVAINAEFARPLDAQNFPIELDNFYKVLKGHWRDMVSKQIESYGSLFESDNG